jgi:hypothetical protein
MRSLLDEDPCDKEGCRKGINKRSDGTWDVCDCPLYRHPALSRAATTHSTTANFGPPGMSIAPAFVTGSGENT